MRDRIAQFISTRRFEWAIIVLVVLNALILGLETAPPVMAVAGPFLRALDVLILSMFVVELLLRFYVHRWSFFKDAWRVFDLIVVAIALIPASAGFSDGSKQRHWPRRLRVWQLCRSLWHCKAVSSAL